VASEKGLGVWLIGRRQGPPRALVRFLANLAMLERHDQVKAVVVSRRSALDLLVVSLAMGRVAVLS
jgi:hypothetical protein